MGRSPIMRRRAASLASAAMVALGTADISSPAAQAAPAPLPVPEIFFQGVVDEMLSPGASAAGTNDYDCEPSAEHPNPVILLHDLGATRQSNWAVFGPALANEGYCVYAISFGVVPGTGSTSMGNPLGGFAPMADSARELDAFVDGVLDAPGTRRGANTGKVDILAQSQGVLVAGYYAKVLGGGAKVDKFVSLVPAWNGFGREFGLGVGSYDALGPAKDQLYKECPYCIEAASGSEFLQELNAGGSPYAPGVKYTNITTRYNWGMHGADGLVPGAGATDIVVQDGCESDYSEHDGIGASPRAFGFALNALDPENPRPAPCGLVIPLLGMMVD